MSFITFCNLTLSVDVSKYTCSIFSANILSIHGSFDSWITRFYFHAHFEWRFLISILRTMLPFFYFWIGESASLSFPFTKPKSSEFEITTPLSLLWFGASDFLWYVSLELMSSSKDGAIINNLPWPLSSVSLTTFPRTSGISFLKSLNMDLISDKI